MLCPHRGGTGRFHVVQPLGQLAQNASAIQVMGVDELKVIATELVINVRKSVTIGWTIREGLRDVRGGDDGLGVRSRGTLANVPAQDCLLQVGGR